MSIITISSIFNNDYNDFIDFCNNTVVADFIDTTTFETTLTSYVYNPIWLRYKDTPIKFSNDEKGQDAFLRNFYNQLSEVVFDFHNYAKENIEYFLYQNDVTKQGKPMSKTVTSGIAPINQTIDQEVDSTNLASGTGSQFVSETVYNGIAWHKLVEGYFTPNRKTEMLKTFQWLFISVYSPETKYDDKIEEKRYVQLSFVDEDNNIIDEQKVYPTKSYFTMSECDIARPENLEPQNIVKDVEIAGILGTYDKPILDYLNYGDAILTDDMLIKAEDYNVDGIKEILITKPATALPENIKDGVNIGGVVGTYIGGADTLAQRITNDNQPYNYETSAVTTIRYNAFISDTNIRSFKSTTVTTIGSGAFQGCTNLTEVDMPNATTNLTTGGQTFRNCTSLTTVNLPLLTQLTDYYFAGTTNLRYLDLDSLNSAVGQYAISASGVISVNLGSATSLGNYCFRNCTSLTDITLKKTSVCTISNINVFDGVTNLVTIHVPSNLITNYQNASYWNSLYSSNKVTFVAI